MRRFTAIFVVFLMSLSAASMLPVAFGENDPPNADAGSDKVAGPGDTVFFDGSGSSDSDGNNLNYSWDFDDSDGIQEDATGVLVSNVYYSVGTFKTTLTVDDGEMTDTDSVTVTIEEDHVNRAPTAVITSPGNFSIHNDTDPVDFDASGSSDPDGDLLTYDWDFGDGDQGTGEVTGHSYTDPGIYTIVLTVDDGEYTSSDSVIILIEGSPGIPGIPGGPGIAGPERPSAKANGPYDRMANSIVNLDSSGSTGAHALDFCWDLDARDGIQSQNCFDEPTINNMWKQNDWYAIADGPYPEIYWPDPGNYTITLIIRDCYGEAAIGVDLVCTYNITLGTANISPHDTVKVDAGKDSKTESGKKTNLMGMVKIEPDYFKEYITKCEWDFESNGVTDLVLTFDVAEKLKKATCSAVNTYVLNQTGKEDTNFTAKLDAFSEGSLRVRPTGNSTRDTIVVTYFANGNDTTNKTIPAPPNLPPIATCVPPDLVAFVGESVSFAVDAVDPDDDRIVQYEWDFNNDGQVDFSNPASGDATYTYKSPGSYVAQANVTDERSGVGYCSVNVTVKSNKAPVAVIEAPLEANAGEDVDFDGSGSYDLDGANEIASYTWDFDSRDGISADATGQYATRAFTKGGSYTVTLTVKDKHGVEGTATHDITIKQDYDVSLSINGQKSTEVDPGKVSTFKFRVINSGNGEDCFDIDKSGPKSTWGELSTTQVCMAADEGRDFELRVSVPHSAKASDQASITVGVTSQGSSGANDEIRVTVKTKQDYEVTAWMQTTSVSIKQGKFVSMSLKITNLGNGEDTIKLTASGPDKGWVSFVKSASVNLDPKEAKDVTVKFTVPKGAKGGEHTITLIATSGGDSTVKDSLMFIITVKEVAGPTVPDFSFMGTVLAISMVAAAIGIARRRR